MSAPNTERAVAPQRIDFVREDYLGTGTYGVTPTDPEFLKYSDNVRNLNATPESVIERRGGLGSPDPRSFERGPESHQITITYDLVKWLGSATGDAAYDGLERQDDNLLPDSHSFLTREDKTQVTADNTVSGNTARPTRLYLYGRGGLVSEGSVMGNPSEQQPIVVELTYRFQYLRAHQIDQPTSDESDTYLTVKSTDSADTSLTVTIEDEGGATSEDVTTDASDGTTVVSTSSQFGGIDSVYVDADNVGDIVVSVNSGDDTTPTEGDELTRVVGSSNYSDVESDYGVPPIGSGSRETVASLGSHENFLGDTIQSDSSPYPYQIQAVNLVFNNNLETTEVADQFGMAVHPGNRNLNWESTIFGENASIDSLQAHFQNTARNQSWEMDGGTVTLDSAHLVEPGEVAKEEGGAVMTVENAWTAEGITFS